VHFFTTLSLITEKISQANATALTESPTVVAVIASPMFSDSFSGSAPPFFFQDY